MEKVVLDFGTWYNIVPCSCDKDMARENMDCVLVYFSYHLDG